MSETIELGEAIRNLWRGFTKRLTNHFKTFDMEKADILSAFSLIIILAASFLIRLFPYLQGYEPLIKAFDPHVQLICAEYINEHGLMEFLQWKDYESWYPYGRDMGYTMYLGIPLTTVIIYKILTWLTIPVTITGVAYIIPPIFGTLGVFFVYKLGKEVISRRAGLISAFFLATVPGYVSRTIAGFYDNESIGVFLVIITFYYFMKALRRDSTKSAILAGIFLGLLGGSWGAYRYVYDLIPLYAFILVVTGNFSHRLMKSTIITMALGTIITILVPRNGGRFVFGVEGFGPLFIVLFLVLVALFQPIAKTMSEERFKKTLFTLIATATVVFVLLASTLLLLGMVNTVADKFISVLIPTDRINLPLIHSVSEHLPLSWSNLFHNAYILVFFIPLGVWYGFKKPTEENLFILTYTLSTLYFTGSMVRLILIFAPAACLMGGFVIDNLLLPYAYAAHGKIAISKTTFNLPTIGRDHAMGAYLFIGFLMVSQTFHGIGIAKDQLSTPEIAPGKPGSTQYYDWFELFEFIDEGLSVDREGDFDKQPVILSWWDYGYYIRTESNATVLVDNATMNSTQIGVVGAMLMLDAPLATILMYKYGVTHVLIHSAAGVIGMGSDLGKAQWPIRISEGYTPQYGVKEADYFDPTSGYYGAFWDSVLFQLAGYTGGGGFGGAATAPFYPEVEQYTILTGVLDNRPATLDWGTGHDYFSEVFRSTGLDAANPRIYPILRLYEVNYPANIEALASSISLVDGFVTE
ncbi:MAG: STT3 domain-containing protein [Candidatus Kariarchaeaceae archaeon]